MRLYRVRLCEEAAVTDIEPFGSKVASDSALLFGAKPVDPGDLELQDLPVGRQAKYTFSFYKDKVFAIDVLLDTARVVYDTDESCHNPDGTWYARKICEHKAGYVIIGHSVGATLKEAEAWCEVKNRGNGFTEEDVRAVVASSFRAQDEAYRDAEPGENECRLRVVLEFDTYLTDEDRRTIEQEVTRVVDDYMNEHEAGMTYRVDLD